MSLFVNDNVVNNALNFGTLITEVDIEQMPEEIPSQILCDKLDINLVKRFIDVDAWTAVIHVINERQALGWFCKTCQINLETCPSVGCDGCLNWYHLKCVKLRHPPKKTHWFCKDCK